MPAQAASTPQIVASQPIPVDITATKALTIEIAKVPDGKPFDPHWTTYLQATATPVIALIAAGIAATIQYRQWQTAKAAAETAKNKLKLDLFDKRFAVFNAVARLVTKLSNAEAHHDNDSVKALMAKTAGTEFLFDETVYEYVTDEIFKHAAILMSLQWAEAQAKARGEHQRAAELAVKRELECTWFEQQLDVLKRHTAPFLQLTH